MSDQDLIRSERFANANKLSMLKKLRKAETITTLHRCQLSCHTNVLSDPRLCLHRCEYFFRELMQKRHFLKTTVTKPLHYIASQQSNDQSGYSLDELANKE